MKRISLVLTMFILVLTCFSACERDNALTVYVVETDALYVNAVKAFQEEYKDIQLNVKTFASYEEMDEQLNTELMGGKGPDVLLFNSLYSTSDVLKLTASNAFMELDEQMEDLEEGAYYTPILDSGVIKGHQYLLPLSWNVMQAYTTKEQLAQKQYAEGESLYTLLRSEAEALENTSDMAVSSLQFGRADALAFFTEITGAPVMNSDTGESALDKESLQKTAEFLKVFYDSMDKIGNITQKYSNDFAGRSLI